MAARDGPPCPIGSCNFVLLRHRLRLRQRALEFFSLLYHLASSEGDSGSAPAPPAWIEAARQDERAWTTLQRGEVAALAIPVEAGELIGRVGEAGPVGFRAPQVHFAVLSREEIGAEVDPGSWQVLDGGDGSRLCHDPWLLRRIERSVGGARPVVDRGLDAQAAPVPQPK